MRKSAYILLTLGQFRLFFLGIRICPIVPNGEYSQLEFAAVEPAIERCFETVLRFLDISVNVFACHLGVRRKKSIEVKMPVQFLWQAMGSLTRNRHSNGN